jgi:hypothetical protein
LPRHTRAGKTRGWAARWAKFNTVAVGTLLVNELVFAVATHLHAPLLLAALTGIVTGGILNFVINHRLTFQDRTGRKNETLEAVREHRPGVNDTRLRLRGEGVAFFLPAFNEAANLSVLLPATVDYFSNLTCPFTIIIINDGSIRDDTYAVAEHLAHTYPGHVQAVHHEYNQGYGAALRTGIQAALQTGHSLIGFCDADDQYEIQSFGTLLAALKSKQAHLAAGYRLVRADSLKRRVMGRGWHWLSRFALGFATARDVDCGFKLFTRAMLADIAPQLRGDHASVSPELLARATKAKYRLVEAGLTHKPRTRGQQTGSNVKVVVMSLIHLFQLRMTLTRERLGAPVVTR